jgi:hypothetical protein
VARQWRLDDGIPLAGIVPCQEAPARTTTGVAALTAAAVFMFINSTTACCIFFVELI